MPTTTTPRRVSLPSDLDALRAEHAAALPSLSSLTVRALRTALRRLGVEVPPQPEAGRTTAASEAARLARIEANASSEGSDDSA